MFLCFNFKRNFFPHSAIYGLFSFGSTKNVLAIHPPPPPPPFLTFYHLLAQLVECWWSKLVKTSLPIQLVGIKVCREFELRVSCACVALLWLVGFVLVFKISSLTPCKQLKGNKYTSNTDSQRPGAVSPLNWASGSHPCPAHTHARYCSAGGKCPLGIVPLLFKLDALSIFNFLLKCAVCTEIRAAYVSTTPWIFTNAVHMGHHPDQRQIKNRAAQNRTGAHTLWVSSPPPSPWPPTPSTVPVSNRKNYFCPFLYALLS